MKSDARQNIFLIFINISNLYWRPKKIFATNFNNLLIIYANNIIIPTPTKTLKLASLGISELTLVGSIIRSTI